jgi:arylsulfatase A-like enzyme
MDGKVGLMVNALQTKGIYDNTVLFFSADNGGPIYGDGSAGANNFPLKGDHFNLVCSV